MFSQIKKLPWRLIQFLGNLQLAIILLLTIACISSLGTIIEQEKTISFYELNYPITKPILGFINYNIILSLGFNHIYTTTWFVILISIFGFSLMSCTFARQIPSLKLATLWKFFKKEKNFRNPNVTFRLNNVNLNEFSYLLRKEQYNVLQEGPYLYAYKGLVGKIGPILVHCSIILILIGSLSGSFLGFTLQELVPKKDAFHLQNVISSGPLSYIRQDFEGYIHDFKIAYSDEGTIDQFYSEIGILDSDLNSKSRKTIFVNEPLRYDGITFYQTDWGIKSIQAIVNDSKKIEIFVKEINLPDKSRFWIGITPITDKLLLVVQDLTGKCLIYTDKKVLLGETEIGHKIFINGECIRITKFIPSTGLQIKSDPGIFLVYLGFLFLIISVLLSYISYFQIWAVKKDTYLYIHGNTNRAVYFFERNLLEMLNILNESNNAIYNNIKNN
jgi:cytochrome c biogenesis protein